MEKKGLYGIVVLCLLMFSSCLGDPATSLTMANQAGVIATNVGPGKVIYVKGGEIISSESFQKANVEDGECILFDYSINYGATENVDGGGAVGYMNAIIYENTITEVGRWNIYSTLSDTAKVKTNELMLSSLQARSAYIKGNLFLFTEIKNHDVNQRDSFALSYDPLQRLDADQVYSLYLRSFSLNEPSQTSQTMIVPCAFDIKDFVNTVSVKNGTDEVKFRINYVSTFGKDSLSIVWKSSDIFTINLSETK